MDTVFNHPSRVLHKIFIRTISKVPEELIVDEIEGEAFFDIAADKPAGNAVFKQLERAAPGLRGKLVPFPKERGREEFAVRLFAAGKGGVNALDEAAPIRDFAAHRGNADVHPLSAGWIDDAHVAVRIARLARFHGIEIPQLHVEGARRGLELLDKQLAAIAKTLAGTFKISCPYPADIVSEALNRFIQIA